MWSGKQDLLESPPSLLTMSPSPLPNVAATVAEEGRTPTMVWEKGLERREPLVTIVSLFDFLNNPIYTFVCVGIHTDVQKLTEDYGLSVATTVDLRSLAAECSMIELRNVGLTNLAREVLGKEIEKPRGL
ncbi:hypothetical protein ACSBR2_034405 [Camellia fascicularis]